MKIGDKAADGSQLRPFIVYPAAGLLNYVPAHVPVYLIDPKQVAIPSGRQVHVIQKGASEGMEELMRLLADEQ